MATLSDWKQTKREPIFCPKQKFNCQHHLRFLNIDGPANVNLDSCQLNDHC